MTNEIVQEMIQLQKRYKELYMEYLIGLDDNYVQLNIENFNKLLQITNAGFIKRDRKDEYYEVYTTIDGVEFCALVKKEWKI